MDFPLIVKRDNLALGNLLILMINELSTYEIIYILNVWIRLIASSYISLQLFTETFYFDTITILTRWPWSACYVIPYKKHIYLYIS